jgi:rubrerythrin
MTAAARYRAFAEKAMKDEYPNIAYTFTAFAISESIHAQNYVEVARELHRRLSYEQAPPEILDTKANVRTATGNELDKIRNLYPSLLSRLKAESYTPAITQCTYALECHRQHEAELQLIYTLSPLFFGSVSAVVEGRKLDFHVCRICGSTIDSEPGDLCPICQYGAEYYDRVRRPESGMVTGL